MTKQEMKEILMNIAEEMKKFDRVSADVVEYQLRDHRDELVSEWASSDYDEATEEKIDEADGIIADYINYKETLEEIKNLLEVTL